MIAPSIQNINALCSEQLKSWGPPTFPLLPLFPSPWISSTTPFLIGLFFLLSNYQIKIFGHVNSSYREYDCCVWVCLRVNVWAFICVRVYECVCVNVLECVCECVCVHECVCVVCECVCGGQVWRGRDDEQAQGILGQWTLYDTVLINTCHYMSIEPSKCTPPRMTLM